MTDGIAENILGAKVVWSDSIETLDSLSKSLNRKINLKNIKSNELVGI